MIWCDVCCKFGSGVPRGTGIYSYTCMNCKELSKSPRPQLRWKRGCRGKIYSRVVEKEKATGSSTRDRDWSGILEQDLNRGGNDSIIM